MNEKGKAIIFLRKKGKTYGEIKHILKLPKSTIAWWLRGVKISKSLEKIILERSRKKWRKNIITYNKINSQVRAEKARLQREKTEEKASREISTLSNKDLKLIGSALYWAEGNIRNRYRLQFANSNPLIIKLIMRFFHEICNIPIFKIKARIHIYPGLKYKKALNFWSKITKLSQNNFYSPQIQISKASKRLGPRNTLPYGTMHLTIMGTEIASRVKGWIKGISERT